MHLVLRREEWFVGDVFFYVKFFGQTDPPPPLRKSTSISARRA